MGNPRNRKVKRRLIGGKVLEPAGLTQVASGDETNATKNANLVDISLYSTYAVSGDRDTDSGKYGATVTNGETDLLTDAISDADGNFSNAGAAVEAPWSSSMNDGETTDLANSAFGLVHYSLPRIRGAETVISGTNAIGATIGQTFIIYTPDGPQSDYVNYYLTSSFDDAANEQAANTGTGSIHFGIDVTGSANRMSLTYLNFYIAGNLYAASSGTPGTVYDRIGISSSAGTVYFNGSGSYATGSHTVELGSIRAADGLGLKVFWSSSVDTVSTQHAGAFIYISASDTAISNNVQD